METSNPIDREIERNTKSGFLADPFTKNVLDQVFLGGYEGFDLTSRWS